MPINEDTIDASDDDNEEISDSKESYNGDISFEYSYQPNGHPNSTTQSQRKL